MLCVMPSASRYILMFSAVLIAIYVIRSGYPFTYLAVLAILPIISLSFKCDDKFATALLSIFTGLFIGHHATLYVYPERSLFHAFLTPIDKVDPFSQIPRNFAVFDNMWRSLTNNFPPLEYTLPVVYITFLYIVLLLLADINKSARVSLLPLLVLFTFIGYYGFIASVVFALLSIYLLHRGATIRSLMALVTSALFGTRGLIAFGLPYYFIFFRSSRRSVKVLLVTVTVALSLALSSYVMFYLGIINSFFAHRREFSLEGLIGAVVNFYVRERLQPWVDFVITSTALLTLITVGFILSIKKRLHIFIINIIVLMTLFVLTFIARLNIFENPASDLPYYFLYASAINSVIVLAVSNARKAVVLILFISLFIGLVPKYGYDAFYEHTFDKIQEYYSLVNYIMTYGANNKYLYDYGSFPYSKYLPNSTMLQPWQSPSRFTNSFYIYSQDIHSMRMFFTLPHIQSQLRQHVRSTIVYDSGQYQISQIK